MTSIKTLWTLAKLGTRSAEIAEELRKIEQRKNDAEFDNALSNGSKNDLVKYCEGYVDGVNWCLKHLS